MQAFNVPVLGADTSNSGALPEPAKEHVLVTESSQEPAHVLQASHVPTTAPAPAVEAPEDHLDVTAPDATKQDANMADVEVRICLSPTIRPSPAVSVSNSPVSRFLYTVLGLGLPVLGYYCMQCPVLLTTAGSTQNVMQC